MALALIALILVEALALMLLTAPEGWEDDDGWHAGRKD